MVPINDKSEEQSQKDFFISYTKSDEKWAEWIAWQLEEAGYSTVVQIWDFKSGSNFILEMDKAIKGTQRTIAVYSPDFFQSLFTQPEWAATLIRDPTGADGRLIPVRIRKCTPDGLLKAISYIDLVDSDTSTAKEILLRKITQERLKPKSAPIFPGQPTISTPPQFPGSLPTLWNIPYRRNPNFIGRDEQLEKLHESLTSGKYAAVTQAISGLGGIGKTQLATEYAYRFSSDYTVVWWLRAEDPAILAAEYAQLADSLGLTPVGTSDLQKKIRTVRSWLEQNRGWLLIFDNALQPRDLHDPQNPERQYLPSCSIGHVIITSRNPHWGELAQPVKVKVFERSESITFLLNRTKETDHIAAGVLAEMLGDLPLALEQAGAFISETPGITTATYQDLFKKHHSELLKREKPPLQYPDTVDTTWRISMDKIRKDNSVAANLLNLFAFFAPDNIPPALLKNRERFLPKLLASVVNDDIEIGDALALLERYSLIESSCQTISIHRLVQLVTRDWLNVTERRNWSKVAVLVNNDAFNFHPDHLQSWQECLPLLPHALSVAEHAENLDAEASTTSEILNKIGLYFQQRAELLDAKRNFERALVIDEKKCGSEHASVARDINNLGGVMRALGNFSVAKICYERALAINKIVYGPEQSEVATVLNNLGLVSRNLGNLREAKEYFEKALVIDEREFGNEHPSVAAVMNNLGTVLLDLGKLQEAKKLFERVLASSERIYGTEHPLTATRANNLGFTLRALGDFSEAEKYTRRALCIDEKSYGPEHPEVAIDVNNLGLILQDMGNLQDAKKCFERALAIDEIAYGPEHPKIAIRVNNLGSIQASLGDFSRAKICFERAQKIDEKTYGLDHTQVAISVNHIGEVLKELGDLPEAKKCFRRALKIFRKHLGDQHSSTNMVRKNLSSLTNR